MYREEIGKVHQDLRETFGFIDFIPRFRSVGEKELVIHVEKCKTTLYDVIENKVRVNTFVQDASAGYNDAGGISSILREFESCKEQVRRQR